MQTLTKRVCLPCGCVVSYCLRLLWSREHRNGLAVWKTYSYGDVITAIKGCVAHRSYQFRRAA